MLMEEGQMLYKEGEFFEALICFHKCTKVLNFEAMGDQ